jgi:hypothetical protein
MKPWIAGAILGAALVATASVYAQGRGGRQPLSAEQKASVKAAYEDVVKACPSTCPPPPGIFGGRQAGGKRGGGGGRGGPLMHWFEGLNDTCKAAVKPAYDKFLAVRKEIWQSRRGAGAAPK